jgi:hypothetical protein
MHWSPQSFRQATGFFFGDEPGQTGAFLVESAILWRIAGASEQCVIEINNVEYFNGHIFPFFNL